MKKILIEKLCKEKNRQIEELTKENIKLKKEIKKLSFINSSKDELISAISHEFKNPISIISGFIDTILNSSLDYETQQKFLKKIQSNALRLSNLIDRLYLLSKLENEKFNIRKSKFDILEVTKEIIDSLNNNRIILKGKSKVINADKELIEIVISNLISNALKYSSDKVTIEIDKEFKIKDKGKGIKENEIELITQKFYRIAKNEWDNSLGIGLHIVKRILQMHNLELKIESKINKGSCFCFDLELLT